MYRTLITVDELLQLSPERLCLLDCRFSLADPAAGAKAYAAGHIPNACFADLERDLSSPVTAASGRHPLPDPTLLSECCARWGIHNETQVVVYDDMGGAMAARAWWLLRWLGHDPVALLDGGLQAWQSAGQPLSVDPSRPQPGVFIPRLRSDCLVDSEQLLAEQQAGAVLVDARAAERYRGEVEPIDPVAGHVPGALSRPFNENLAVDGCFKSVADLAAEWKQLLGAKEVTRSIMMCGSGVTACHHLLAIAHAGLGSARLYAGSWSEWIRDPAREIAIGK